MVDHETVKPLLERLPHRYGAAMTSLSGGAGLVGHPLSEGSLAKAAFSHMSRRVSCRLSSMASSQPAVEEPLTGVLCTSFMAVLSRPRRNAYLWSYAFLSPRRASSERALAGIHMTIKTCA